MFLCYWFLLSHTICGITDCYNSVLHLAQIGAQFSHGTFPGSERMQAETEDYLVEWRGCVAQLVNLISPVACFSEVFGILVLNRMLCSSPSLSFTFPVSKWFWFHHCLFNLLLSQSSLPFVLSWRWLSTGSGWHFEWPASPCGSSWIVRAVVCSAPSGFCFSPCCAEIPGRANDKWTFSPISHQVSWTYFDACPVAGGIRRLLGETIAVCFGLFWEFNLWWIYYSASKHSSLLCKLYPNLYYTLCKSMWYVYPIILHIVHYITYLNILISISIYCTLYLFGDLFFHFQAIFRFEFAA